MAGGRDVRLEPGDLLRLGILGIDILVSGMCDGVDLDSVEWARRNGIPVKPFPVERWEWDLIGKPAGPLRNRTMAAYASELVLFPGGRGTQSMHDIGVEFGLVIHDWRKW